MVWVSSGIGSALSVAVSLLLKGLTVLYLYTGLAVIMIVVVLVFWVTFHRYN